MSVASYTRTKIRQEALDRLPFLGFAVTLDSVAAGSFTSVSAFQHSNYSSDEFSDRWMYRYNRTGDDRVKRTTTLSTATLSHGGSNNSNTSDLDAELLSIQPDELNDAIARAARRKAFKTLGPLTPGTDYHMERSGVNYWDGTSGSSAASNLTPTKATSDVFSGTQALKLAASAGSAYCRGEKLGASRISLQVGRVFYSACIVRADVGTVDFSWRDVTNGAAIAGTTTSYSGEGWVLIERRDVLPTGCEEIQPVFTLTGASDIAYVDTIFGPYTYGQRLFRLQAWLDATFKIRALRPIWHTVSISAGIFDAFSREFYDDWVQPTDFEAEL